MKTLNKFFILAAGISLTTAAAFADYSTTVEPTPTLSPATSQNFVSDVVWGNDKEVALGQLAQQRSQNPDVKAFAERMISDHSRANQKIITIANREGLNYPATNIFYFGASAGTTEMGTAENPATSQNQPSLDNPKGLPAQALGMPPLNKRNADIIVYRDLGSLSGADFDKSYANQMVKDHAEDIQKFENASTALDDPQLKQFASQTLPTLREHYRMAQDLRRKAGETPTSPNRSTTSGGY